MKTFAFLLFISLAVATVVADYEKNLQEARSTCQSETQVDQSFVDGIQHQKFPDDPKFKEYLFCVGKKLGFQNEGGDFDTTAIGVTLKTKYPADLVDKAVNQCYKKKETPQESAYQALKCALPILVVHTHC